MIFDIPVIITVKAENIEEARQIVYKSVEGWENGLVIPGEGSIAMADDSTTNRLNQRIVFLHPEDSSAVYEEESDNKTASAKE